ncbi:MAG TPA: ester cyclase [Acidimicrobiales bacterium]|nr:ester cyclase [Acidimicrobiales bacterium]
MTDLAEKSKALLRRITDEIWTGGRLDLVDELIAEDFTDHVELPGLEERGRRRYRTSVEMVRQAFPDYREEILWMVGEDDRAVSYVRSTGTHGGPLHGIEPTGRTVRWHSMGGLRFARGQAVERWGVGDSLAMLRQLGLFG